MQMYSWASVISLVYEDTIILNNVIRFRYPHIIKDEWMLIFLCSMEIHCPKLSVHSESVFSPSHWQEVAEEDLGWKSPKNSKLSARVDWCPYWWLSNFWILGFDYRWRALWMWVDRTWRGAGCEVVYTQITHRYLCGVGEVGVRS